MFFCHMERDQDETIIPIKKRLRNSFRIARAFQDKIYCICVVYDLTNFPLVILPEMIFFTTGLDCKSSSTFKASST